MAEGHTIETYGLAHTIETYGHTIARRRRHAWLILLSFNAQYTHYSCMYVCMYVCIYVCIFVCMYVLCMYVCIYACMHVCYIAYDHLYSALYRPTRAFNLLMCYRLIIRVL